MAVFIEIIPWKKQKRRFPLFFSSEITAYLTFETSDFFHHFNAFLFVIHHARKRCFKKALSNIKSLNTNSEIHNFWQDMTLSCNFYQFYRRAGLDKRRFIICVAVSTENCLSCSSWKCRNGFFWWNNQFEQKSIITELLVWFISRYFSIVCVHSKHSFWNLVAPMSWHTLLYLINLNNWKRKPWCNRSMRIGKSRLLALQTASKATFMPGWVVTL